MSKLTTAAKDRPEIYQNLERKITIEHNRNEGISKLLAREKPGQRSRGTLKEIANVLLDFPTIVRYVQLLDITQNSEIIAKETEAVKILVDEVAQWVDLYPVPSGQAVFTQG